MHYFIFVWQLHFVSSYKYVELNRKGKTTSNTETFFPWLLGNIRSRSSCHCEVLVSDLYSVPTPSAKSCSFKCLLNFMKWNLEIEMQSRMHVDHTYNNFKFYSISLPPPPSVLLVVIVIKYKCNFLVLIIFKIMDDTRIKYWSNLALISSAKVTFVFNYYCYR